MGLCTNLSIFTSSTPISSVITSSPSPLSSPIPTTVHYTVLSWLIKIIGPAVTRSAYAVSGPRQIQAETQLSSPILSRPTSPWLGAEAHLNPANLNASQVHLSSYYTFPWPIMLTLYRHARNSITSIDPADSTILATHACHRSPYNCQLK